MMVNSVMPNLQSLKLDVLDLIPNNVLDEIAVMASLTELAWVIYGFGCDKMHELLSVYAQRSDSIIATTTSTSTTATPTRSLSLFTKLTLVVINGGMNDAIVITISSIQTLTYLDISYQGDRIVSRIFIRNVVRLPVLKEDLDLLVAFNSLMDSRR